jgi:hypothetical protein
MKLSITHTSVVYRTISDTLIYFNNVQQLTNISTKLRTLCSAFSCGIVRKTKINNLVLWN